MSYNGIGLSTARGSGTNGFIQKNNTRSIESSYSKRQSIKKQNESRKNDDLIINRDQELIKHDLKRKEIDLKLSEYIDQLEDQGLNDDELDKKCNEFKEELIRKLNIKKGYKPRKLREELNKKDETNVNY